MSSLENFLPANSAELFARIEQEISSEAIEWWTENKTLVSGYIRALSEAAMQTQIALSQSRIAPEDAEIILLNQEAALRQIIRYTKFSSLILAQRLLDSIFMVVGWAIYNRTGVNLFPGRVTPTQEN
ncbi:MAG: hypothetical protein ACXIVO_11820 [Glycocaulis sp.]